MIKHVDGKPLKAILLSDSDTAYSIPKYQRAYTWGQNEWDLLFNDVMENEVIPNHRVGGLTSRAFHQGSSKRNHYMRNWYRLVYLRSLMVPIQLTIKVV